MVIHFQLIQFGLKKLQLLTNISILAIPKQAMPFTINTSITNSPTLPTLMPNKSHSLSTPTTQSALISTLKVAPSKKSAISQPRLSKDSKADKSSRRPAIPSSLSPPMQEVPNTSLLSLLVRLVPTTRQKTSTNVSLLSQSPTPTLKSPIIPLTLTLLINPELSCSTSPLRTSS